MGWFWPLTLLILLGCNVAKEPATLSEGSGLDNSSGVPIITFSTAALNRMEGSPIASIPFTLSQTATAITTINVTFSGTAVGGSSCTGAEDYITPVMPVAYPAGTTSGVIDIILCNDSIYEGSETIVATISSVTPTHAFGSNAIAVVSLYDSLPVPQVAFATASSGSIAEGSSGVTTIPVTVQLSHLSTLATTFQVSTSGTASSSTDFGLSATMFTIPANTLSTTVFVNIYGDNLIEPNESVSLNIFAPVNASIGAQNIHDLQIAQDEAPSTLQASMGASVNVNEVAGIQNLTVSITGATDHSTILNYTIDFSAAITSTQRAAFPSDFTLSGSASSSGFVTVPAGATTVNIPINIVDDGFYEPSEGIIVRLLGGPEITVSTGFETAQLQINSNDAANQPLVSFLAPTQSINEANPAGSVVVRLLDPALTGAERASGEDVVVTLTTSNLTSEGAADWVLGSTTVTIPAGQTRATVPVTVIQDGVDEDNETFSVSLTPPAGYSTGPNTTHTVSILDADAASRVRFAVASSTVNESTAPTAPVVTVTLDKASERNITVNYSLSGSATSNTTGCSAGVDLTHPGTLLIPAGSTSLAFTGITQCADTVSEGSETAVFTINSVNNGILSTPYVHTTTIVDDEPLPDLSISSTLCDAPTYTATGGSISETGSCVRLVASITNAVTSQNALNVPLSISGTAILGTHYNTPSSVISIPAGSSSGTLNLVIINNNLFGGDRILNATLGAGSWTLTTATETLTILEDEAQPTVEFSVASKTVNETVGTDSIVLRVTPGMPACEEPISFTLSTTGSTSSYGLDHNFNAPSASIAAGASFTTLTYSVFNDLMYEGATAETLQVEIGTAQCGAVVLAENIPITIISIVSDDPLPILGYAVQTLTTSEGTVANIIMSIDRPSSTAVTFNSTCTSTVPAIVSTTNVLDPAFYAANCGTEMAFGSTSFSIAPGLQSAIQTVTLTADGFYEFTEQFTMGFNTVSGASISASTPTMNVLVNNVDAAPYVHLSTVNNPATLTSTASSLESAATAHTIHALLSNSATSGGATYSTVVPVVVPVSIGGTAAATTTTANAADYTLVGLSTSGGDVIVPALSSSASFTMTVVNDLMYENTETAIFNVSAPSSAQLSSTHATNTITITADGDAMPAASVAANPLTTNEGDLNQKFVITMPPVGKQVVVNYAVTGTATLATDHNMSASGSVTFSPSTTTQTYDLNFSVTDDILSEAAETIITTITSSDILTSPTSGTMTINVSDPIQLAAGDDFTCALLDGQVKCWGRGGYLGDGTTAGSGTTGTSSGRTVLDFGSNFTPIKVVAGRFHACALSQQGSVKCWGRNDFGQLGLDLAGSTPYDFIGDAAGEMGDSLPVVNLGATMVDVVAGGYHTCAMTESGQMKCWGYNVYGQLGQIYTSGATCNASGNRCYGDAPGELASMGFIGFPVSSGVAKMAAGAYHTCALLLNNDIYCFGWNGYGQLGRNDTTNYGGGTGEMTNPTTFKKVQLNAFFSSKTVLAISGGHYGTCALFSDTPNQRMLCWGSDFYGEGGVGWPQSGPAGLIGSSATFVLGSTLPLTNINAGIGVNYVNGQFLYLSQISAGLFSSCTLNAAGKILCWGYGTNGNLGNGTNFHVGDGVSDTSMSGYASPWFFCDIEPYGSTNCGVTGDGSMVNGTYTGLYQGNYHTCASVGHDQYRCWGENAYGELGSGVAGNTNSSPGTGLSF